MENIFIDRLVEVELELDALNYHLNLLEKQINNIQAFERLSLEKRIKKLGYTPDDPEWQNVQREFDYTIEFFVPRIFRSPFVISLYAVYESAVIEIAKLVQEKKGIPISINEKGKRFNLDNALEYYKENIDFPLYADNVAWERIRMLSVIRHAFAHTNGRMEMLDKSKKEKVAKYEKQKVGISSMDGFIVLEEDFLRITFKLVNTSLNEVVKRYRDWNYN